MYSPPLYVNIKEASVYKIEEPMKDIPAFTKEYVHLDREKLVETLWLMLGEDNAKTDVTSAFTPDKKVKANVTVKEKGFVSGIAELSLLFELAGARVEPSKADGDRVGADDVVFTLEGNAGAILKVERTALNVLARMSGITTLTRRYVDALESVGSSAKVAATRKTTPLFRYFEKKAVVAGGGVPHRMSLEDMVLIKDNHLKVFGGVSQALEAAKSKNLEVPVEIEVDNLEDAVTAAEEGADIVMLDNMTPEQVGDVLAALKEKGLRDNVCIEVSGRINLETITEYGKQDVDVISIGGLTMNAPSLDVSLEFVSVSE